MPRPHYVLRFDDINPRMNWSVWNRLESELRAMRIRPIVAVIPDNRDASLVVDPPKEEFWERVRGWQAEGWVIGLHGHQHILTPGRRGPHATVGHSEFFGLPKADQRAKLEAALGIFAANGVTPEIWVAPAHSFDGTTVALLKSLGVSAVSDGYEPFPYEDATGMIWMPQQLWRLRKISPGIWTVCLHHNHWTSDQATEFIATLRHHRGSIAHARAALRWAAGRRRRLMSRVAAAIFRRVLLLRTWLRSDA